MIRRPPISTRTDTLFPYPTLFRTVHQRLAPFLDCFIEEQGRQLWRSRFRPAPPAFGNGNNTVQASAQFAGEPELGCCRAFKPLLKIYRVIGAYVAPLSKAALLGNPRLLALPVLGRHEDECHCCPLGCRELGTRLNIAIRLAGQIA